MALCQVEALLNKEPVGIVLISREGEMCAEVVLCFLIVILAEDIGRIADDCIKAATFHNFWILGLPVEGIDAVAFFLIEETHLFVIIKIWPDKGVTGRLREGMSRSHKLCRVFSALQSAWAFFL